MGGSKIQHFWVGKSSARIILGTVSHEQMRELLKAKQCILRWVGRETPRSLPLPRNLEFFPREARGRPPQLPATTGSLGLASPAEHPRHLLGHVTGGGLPWPAEQVPDCVCPSVIHSTLTGPGSLPLSKVVGCCSLLGDSESLCLSFLKTCTMRRIAAVISKSDSKAQMT